MIFLTLDVLFGGGTFLWICLPAQNVFCGLCHLHCFKQKNTQFWTTLTLPSGAQNALYMVWSSMYLLVIDSLINELILWLIEFFTYLSLDLLTILVLVVSSTKSCTHWLLIYNILVQHVRLIHVHFYFLVFCTYITEHLLTPKSMCKGARFSNTPTLEHPEKQRSIGCVLEFHGPAKSPESECPRKLQHTPRAHPRQSPSQPWKESLDSLLVKA